MDQSNQRDPDEKRRLLPNIGDSYSATIAGHSATLTGMTTAKIHMRKKAKPRPNSHRKHHEKTSSYGERTKQRSKVSTSPERPTSGPFGDLCHGADTQTDSDNLLPKKTRTEKMLSTSSENLPPWRPAGLAIGKSYPRQLVFETTKPQMYRRRTGTNPFHGLEPIPPIKQKAARKDRLNSGKLKHTNKHRHQGCLESHDNWKSDFDIKPNRGSEKESYLHSARKVVKVHPRIARNKLLDSDPDGLLSSCHRSIKTTHENHESSDVKAMGTEGSQGRLNDETDVMDDHTHDTCETQQRGTPPNSCPCWKSCVKSGASTNVRWVTFKDYLDHQLSRQDDQNKNGLPGPPHHQHDQNNGADNNAHDSQANNSNHKSTIAFCKAEEHALHSKTQNDCEKYTDIAAAIIEAEGKCDIEEQCTTSVDGEPASSEVTRNKEQSNAEERGDCENQIDEISALDEVAPAIGSIVDLDKKDVNCSAVDLIDTVLSNLEGSDGAGELTTNLDNAEAEGILLRNETINDTKTAFVSNFEGSHGAGELTTNIDTAGVDEGIILRDETNDPITAIIGALDTEVGNLPLHDSLSNEGKLRKTFATPPGKMTPYAAQLAVSVEKEQDAHLSEYDENATRNDSENEVMNQCNSWNESSENEEGINLPETGTFEEQSSSGTVVDADENCSSPLREINHPSNYVKNCETHSSDDATDRESIRSLKSAVSEVKPDSAMLVAQSHVTDGLTDVSGDERELFKEDQKENRQCKDAQYAGNGSAETHAISSEHHDENIDNTDEITQDIRNEDSKEVGDLCHANKSKSSTEALNLVKVITDKTSSERLESSPSGEYLPQDPLIQDDEPAFPLQKSPSEEMTMTSELDNQESGGYQEHESPSHTEDSPNTGKATTDLPIPTPSINPLHVTVDDETEKQNRGVHFSEICDEESNRRSESVAGPVVTDVVEKNPIPPCLSTFDFTVQRPNTAPEKSSDIIGQLYPRMQPENKIPPNSENPAEKQSKVTDDGFSLMAWPDSPSSFPPVTGDTQFDKAFEGINVINLYANLVARYSFRSQNRIREALEQMPPDDNLHRRATMCTPAKKCAREVHKFRQALQDLFMRYFRIEQAQDELCWFVRNMSRTSLQRVNEAIDSDVSEAQVLQAIEEEVAVAAKCPNREMTSGTPSEIPNNRERLNFGEDCNFVVDDRANSNSRDDTDKHVPANFDVDNGEDSGQSGGLNALSSTSTLGSQPSVPPKLIIPEVKDTHYVIVEDTNRSMNDGRGTFKDQ